MLRRVFPPTAGRFVVVVVVGERWTFEFGCLDVAGVCTILRLVVLRYPQAYRIA